MPRKKIIWPTVTERFGNLPGSANRRAYEARDGFHGKPEWPDNPLQLTFKRKKMWFVHDIEVYPPYPNGARPVPDGPNTAVCYYNWRWDTSAYSSVYGKFAERAKNGSAALGLNIVEARKTYSGLVGSVVTVGRVLKDLYRAHELGAKYLIRNPNTTIRSAKYRLIRLKREIERAQRLNDRRLEKRLRAELRQLEHASSLFLAWRYGISPLMGDIFTMADMLSGEKIFRNTKVRVSGSFESKVRYHSAAVKEDGTRKVSCSISAYVECSNENLLLANRLGLINPATIAWELIPYSFLVDWFLPVGQFLENFTATAGMKFLASSSTQTITVDALHQKEWRDSKNQKYWVSNPFFSYYKERVAGPLPAPLSVPYRTGIGVARAQNALALAVQLFKPSKKV